MSEFILPAELENNPQIEAFDDKLRQVYDYWQKKDFEDDILGKMPKARVYENDSTPGHDRSIKYVVINPRDGEID